MLPVYRVTIKYVKTKLGKEPQSSVIEGFYFLRVVDENEAKRLAVELANKDRLKDFTIVRVEQLIVYRYPNTESSAGYLHERPFELVIDGVSYKRLRYIEKQVSKFNSLTKSLQYNSYVLCFVLSILLLAKPHSYWWWSIPVLAFIFGLSLQRCGKTLDDLESGIRTIRAPFLSAVSRWLAQNHYDTTLPDDYMPYINPYYEPDYDRFQNRYNSESLPQITTQKVMDGCR
jgi:hypothetical protein